MVEPKHINIANVRAYTTTRHGGVSEAPFHGFNLGTHVCDSLARVNINRQQLEHFCQFAPIQWLNQTHSNDVIKLCEYSATPINGDAVYTKVKNQPIAILTADCLPILLVNELGSEIAAIHGGWRPLAGNIIAHTLLKFDSQRSNIYAWLGPCIGAQAFEVGENVKLAFCQSQPKLSIAFCRQANGKYLADLHLIARIQLHELGVDNIASLAECTFQNSEKYFSFRKQPKTGRMASIICLK